MPGKILVVEDDEGTRLILRTALREQGFDVIEAADGSEGMTVFDTRSPDLLIADLNLPIVDGFTLIAHVMNTRPAVPVVVVSAMDRTIAQQRILHAFRLTQLTKPIDLESLAEAMDQALSPSGSITGITLFGFLQMLSLEKQTSTLRIESGSDEGLMCLEDGRVVEAFTAGKRGLEAAFEILELRDPRIEILPPRDLVERSIEVSTTELLMEAAQRFDEASSRFRVKP